MKNIALVLSLFVTGLFGSGGMMSWGDNDMMSWDNDREGMMSRGGYQYQDETWEEHFDRMTEWHDQNGGMMSWNNDRDTRSSRNNGTGRMMNGNRTSSRSNSFSGRGCH